MTKLHINYQVLMYPQRVSDDEVVNTLLGVVIHVPALKYCKFYAMSALSVKHLVDGLDVKQYNRTVEKVSEYFDYPHQIASYLPKDNIVKDDYLDSRTSLLADVQTGVCASIAFDSVAELRTKIKELAYNYSDTQTVV